VFAADADLFFEITDRGRGIVGRERVGKKRRKMSTPEVPAPPAW
jgi:hypothetical protein